MTYKTIPPEDWSSVEHEFTSRGVGLPDPSLAFIVGAFSDEGKLAGFMVCQPQLHAEPLCLYDPFALRGLIHALESELMTRYGTSHYYAFAADRVAGMAEAVGMKKLEVGVYQKCLS